jgi:hypothetical protein
MGCYTLDFVLLLQLKLHFSQGSGYHQALSISLFCLELDRSKTSQSRSTRCVHSLSFLSWLLPLQSRLSSPIAAAEAKTAPAATTTGEGVLRPGSLGTAIGGALVIQTDPPLIANIASPSRFLTITVIHSHGDAISTSHVYGASEPGWSLTSGDSLIEASFRVSLGYTVAVAAMDVSYV